MKSIFKYAIWLAPLLSLFGFLSYFTFFYQYPVLRDNPILNLGITLTALLLAMGGLVLFWPVTSLLGKSLRVLGSLVGLFCFGMLTFYVFFLSFQLPGTEKTEALSSAPPINLPQIDGGMVSSSSEELRDRHLLVSFYRGFW